MHFLLALLGLVLDRLFPAWRDGLRMAARADGRIELVPTPPGLWDRCLSWLVSGEPLARDGKKLRSRRAPARQPSPGDSPGL
jgi:hypothetical protein